MIFIIYYSLSNYRANHPILAQHHCFYVIISSFILCSACISCANHMAPLRAKMKLGMTVGKIEDRQSKSEGVGVAWRGVGFICGGVGKTCDTELHLELT